MNRRDQLDEHLQLPTDNGRTFLDLFGHLPRRASTTPRPVAEPRRTPNPSPNRSPDHAP